MKFFIFLAFTALLIAGFFVVPLLYFMLWIPFFAF